ncbi:sialic acid-binding Ig-like lectin 5 isoform X2 [Labrus bergylta]|uniref:sialic acid-binding Ig-like lectin 5 isoform X2 n=1 Tax=Labrus bergylta TaxID=56723 RepID=UPI0033142215
MSPLIWATLLFSAWGIIVKAATSDQGVNPCTTEAFSVTLRQEEITAEAGLCVVIPCSFTTCSPFTSKYYVWMKCVQSKRVCGDSDVIFNTTVPSKEVQRGFRDRVSLLEPDVRKKNCSIIINDLTASDSGSYQFRVESDKINHNGKQDGFTFASKINVSVTDLTQKPTLMIPPLTEGLQSTLTCTAPGLCSGSAPEITWMWRGGGGENDSHITGNITDFKTETLTDVEQRHSSALSFTPSAKHHGTNITCQVRFTGGTTAEETVTLNVTYLKKPVIVGNTTVKDGDSLNLTCTADSFPPSVITWTKLGSNKSFNNLTGMAELIIPNMTTEDSGKYTCSATNPNKTDSTQTEVKLGLSPRILHSSACVVQSDVLTCVCISEGFPLPTIEWPLLKNHTQYSVTTNKTKHSVNSNITVSVKDHNYTTVLCVSSSEVGDVKKTLEVITKNVTKPDVTEHLSKLLQLITQPQVIIAFLIGVLLTATICCLIRTCHRKKPRRSGNMALDNLEMVNTHADSLMDAGQALGNGGANGGAEGDIEPREVEYSNINISLLERSPRRAQDVQASTESEYAEIKRDKTEERLDNDDQNEEILEGSEKEEAMMEEDGKDCVPEKEEGDDVALYSNLKDVMGAI